MLTTTTLPTPLGPLLAVTSPGGLCGLEFDGPDRERRLRARLRHWRPGEDTVEGEDPLFHATGHWLDAYFARRWDALPGLTPPLDLLGTDFERAVWRELSGLRPGATSSYGAIALRLGRPGAARAVGAAVGANPVSLIVPCHRVVGASGSLTGYGGGLDRKRWLLGHEGARLL